jgi:hypothetical protein
MRHAQQDPESLSERPYLVRESEGPLLMGPINEFQPSIMRQPSTEGQSGLFQLPHIHNRRTMGGSREYI